MGRITTQPLVARLSANIEVFAELRDAEAAGGRQTDKLKLLVHWGYIFPGLAHLWRAYRPFWCNLCT